MFGCNLAALDLVFWCLSRLWLEWGKIKFKMAHSLTVCGRNISKPKQVMLKLQNNLINDLKKNSFKWAKNIFCCPYPLIGRRNQMSNRKNYEKLSFLLISAKDVPLYINNTNFQIWQFEMKWFTIIVEKTKIMSHFMRHESTRVCCIRRVPILYRTETIH